jgi:succinate-semialdehyde dehydrogenase / glutarate-semialdehyde dehydrogenase
VRGLEDLPDAEVEQAISGGGRTAFLSWRQTSFAERAKIMLAAAEILQRETDDYSKLLTLEMGKLLTEAKLEVALAANIFDYYAKNAERLLIPERERRERGSRSLGSDLASANPRRRLMRAGRRVITATRSAR